MQIDLIVTDPQRLLDVNEKDRKFLSLCQAMENHGVWEPIIVRPIEEGKFFIVAGYPQLVVAQKLGWKEIDAKVVETDALGGFLIGLALEKDEHKFNKMLGSVIHKFGEAATIRLMSSYGIPPERVRKCALLSRLIDPAWNAVLDGSLPMAQASVLAGATPMKQRELLQAAKTMPVGKLREATVSRRHPQNEVNKGLRNYGITATLRQRSGDELRRAIISPDYMQPFLSYDLTPVKIREAREVLRWAMSVDEITQTRRLEDGK